MINLSPEHKAIAIRTLLKAHDECILRIKEIERALSVFGMNIETVLNDNKKDDISPNTMTKVSRFMSDYNISKIENLAVFSKAELSKYKNIGKRTIDTMEDLLKEKGLTFKPN